MQGTILRAYGGFYYVLAEGKEWECHLRGKHKIRQKEFLPGDKVIIQASYNTSGTIEEVLPRNNRLLRPPVANVDLIVIVASLKKPDVDLALLDRLLLLAEVERIRPLIVLNKADLLERSSYQEIIERYQPAYQVLITSAKIGLGIEDLRKNLSGKISVLAGPSGVGKSSILNAVQKGLKLSTGMVSEKTNRGKHTTRFVNLLLLNEGGKVADTPGFSRLVLPKIPPEGLEKLFPDFKLEEKYCKFSNCLHYKEPGCAVKEAVFEGLINEGRYQRYLQFLEELRNKELV